MYHRDLKPANIDMTRLAAILRDRAVIEAEPRTEAERWIDSTRVRRRPGVRDRAGGRRTRCSCASV